MTRKVRQANCSSLCYIIENEFSMRVEHDKNCPFLKSEPPSMPFLGIKIPGPNDRKDTRVIAQEICEAALTMFPLNDVEKVLVEKITEALDVERKENEKLKVRIAQLEHFIQGVPDRNWTI